jgi:hypothetical protein
MFTEVKQKNLTYGSKSGHPQCASATLNLRYCPLTINEATYIVAIADREIISLCFGSRPIGQEERCRLCLIVICLRSIDLLFEDSGLLGHDTMSLGLCFCDVLKEHSAVTSELFFNPPQHLKVKALHYCEMSKPLTQQHNITTQKT